MFEATDNDTFVKALVSPRRKNLRLNRKINPVQNLMVSLPQMSPLSPTVPL